MMKVHFKTKVLLKESPLSSLKS